MRRPRWSRPERHDGTTAFPLLRLTHGWLRPMIRAAHPGSSPIATGPAFHGWRLSMQFAMGLLAIVLPGGTVSPARSRRRPAGQSGIASQTGPGPLAEARRIRVTLASILSGAAISVAWWFPGTVASALLGWGAAILLVYA